MSDSQQPRPKPGSLRDRIAAFERPSQSAQSPGPPPPRPKPSGVQWRPKQQPQPQQAEEGDGQDPTTPPGAESLTSPKAASASMSASDARESIRQGGSLKERMAALQGRGAFGGLGGGGSGAKETSPPPPPPSQKPKWKPPPQVSFVPAEGEKVNEREESATPSAREAVALEEEDKDKREEEGRVEAGVVEENRGQEEEQQGEHDPEEEERQRRAAIAARMARLGGARVGMAPPGMFGGVRAPPPVARKPEALRASTARENEVEAITLPSSPPPVVPAVEEAPSLGADSEPGSDATPSHSRSPPPSMPAPAVPRRTAPPRRKPPKSPVPPLPEVEPEAAPVEVAQAEPETQATAENLEVLADVEPLAKEERREVEVQPVEEVETMQNLVAETVGEEEMEVTVARDDEAEAVVEEPEQQVQALEEEEEDAETRRKRIAERIAKMGAINPLAPPPISRGSVSDEVEVTLVRRSSVDSVSSVKSGGLAKRASTGPVISPPVSAGVPPVRRSSVDSVHSAKSVAASIGSVGSPTNISFPARRTSVDSVRELESGSVKGAVVGGIPEQDEREEAVDENVPEEEQVQEEEEEGSNDALAASIILERPPPSNIIQHEAIPVPAPPVDRSTRPPIPVSDDPSQTQIESASVYHQRRSSGYVTRPRQSDDEREHDHRGSIAYTTEPSRASPPPLPISPRTVDFVPASLSRRFTARDEDEDDEEEEEETRPLPIPHRTSSILSPRPALKKEPDVEEVWDEEQEEVEEQVKHVPPPPTRRVPLPPPSVSTAEAELPVGPPPPVNADSTPPIDGSGQPKEQDAEQVQEQVPGSAHSDAPLVIPPPERRLSKSGHVTTSDRPLPHPMSFRQPQVPVVIPQREVMDDEEGDPIDPSIHVPRRVPGRTSQVAVPAPPPPPALVHKVEQDQEEEGKVQEVVDPNAADVETARRRTIAERMAKLGGIKFGAAPPVPVARLSSMSAEGPGEAERHEQEAGEGDGGDGEEEKKEMDEEEEERARKERIAAKLAGMGGMRIGMMPPTMGFPPRPPQRSLPPAQAREEVTPIPAHPPPAVAPRGRPTRQPPPPQPQEVEWEHDSASNSEEGVKVDMEESDMEEVNHEDAKTDEDHEDYEDGEMVAPPPPPRVHQRPPVPSTSNIRNSIGSSLGRKSSVGSTTTTQTASTSPQRTRAHSDFVMVDEPQSIGEEGVPPPPPARPLQRRPTREAPPQPSMSDSISSQWELPTIPSGGLGLGTDLSMSWTETEDLAATLVPPSHAPPPAPAELASPTHSPTHAGPGPRLSSEELNAIWKRVGVQVCEAAMQLFEKSKKTVVGDGTYAGFVHAVLNDVPNAAKSEVGQEGWGYLVYAQTGSAVQKRMSEIMSGDVVEFMDARFKGHKGLQSYSQHVGTVGEPVVGVVVSEVEQKKTKVKVVQANRHVGQQTVESVSYRLEDLKSGTVKVYRILEA